MLRNTTDRVIAQVLLNFLNNGERSSDYEGRTSVNCAWTSVARELAKCECNVDLDRSDRTLMARN